MRHPLRRMLVVVTTLAAVVLSTMSPAGAAATDETVTIEPVRPVIDDGPIPLPEPVPPVELLRIRCRGKFNRDHLPGVLCRWTPPRSSAAEVLVLERSTGGQDFTPIWRTGNMNRHRYFDQEVRPGVRYRYRVRAYDANHRLVAASRANGAGVPIPDFDLLKLDCKGGIADNGHKAAKCEWSPTKHAESYQLWRIVNRGHRELVGTYGADVLGARDRLPRNARVVRYAVLALDGNEHIVGRSRVATVRFPGLSTDLAIDSVIDRTATDRAV